MKQLWVKVGTIPASYFYAPWVKFPIKQFQRLRLRAANKTDRAQYGGKDFYVEVNRMEPMGGECLYFVSRV